MKKTVSVLLSLLMLASAFFALPSASADMTADYIKGSNQELLDLLNKLDPAQFADYSDLGLTEEQFNEIKEEAVKIVWDSGAVSDYDSLKAISAWVNANIAYDNDLTGGSQDAYNVFIKRLGICQGYSNLTTAMCAAVGIPCIMVNGDSSAGGHAWSMAYADGRWIFIDNTWGMSWFDSYIDTFSQTHKPYYTNDIMIQDGDFIYTYFNGVAPCKYAGDGTDWVIPSAALDMPVTAVSIDLFNSYDCPVESLYIPETVKNMELSSLVFCSKLEAIEVAENNQYFASLYGVLFDKSFSQILLYPANKQESAFAIPDTVTELGESVFEKNTNLTDVLIPGSVTSIGKAPFADNSKVTVYADEGTFGYEYAVSNQISCKPTEDFPYEQQPAAADKTALEKLFNEIKDIENVYTVNSYRSFSAALGLAADVLKNEDADQEDVDLALEGLKSAYENLKYIHGDVNHDGKITIDDVTNIQKYLAALDLESFDEALADVNNSQSVTIVDATICQMVLANNAYVDDDGNVVL